MSGSREYDGDPVDMSWDTAPWNNDGETIEASDDNAEEHNMDTIEWPENATPKEELNDDQIAVIKKAARYPTFENSRKLTRLACSDRSNAYAASVLANHWPERYWNDAKGHGKVKELTENEIVKARKMALEGYNQTQMSQEIGGSKKAIGSAVRGDPPNGGVASPPPLEYNYEEQGYSAKKPQNKDSKAPQQEKQSTLTPSEEPYRIQKMREMALEGMGREEIAKEFGTGVKSVGRRLRGDVGFDIESPPPLEYDYSEGQYVKSGKSDPDEVRKEAEDDTPEQPENTGYEPHTPTEPDTPGAWAYVAVVAVVYGIYRLIRRLF